jgi:hypothetical protein
MDSFAFSGCFLSVLCVMFLDSLSLGLRDIAR